MHVGQRESKFAGAKINRGEPHDCYELAQAGFNDSRFPYCWKELDVQKCSLLNRYLNEGRLQS